MGSFCSPSPQVQTSDQTQTYTPHPEILKAGKQAIGMARSAASSPFQMPAAPVAGFTPFQDQAYSQILGLQGDLGPYFQNASADLSRAANPVTQADTASYLNPFAEGALANMNKYIFAPQRRDTMANAVNRSGGYGAERLALTSQNLDKTQSDALTQAYTNFYLPAQQQAQRAKEMALQSAQGWANLGLNRQAGELRGTGALMQAGAQQQQQAQNVLMSPYQQTLARIAYPFQTAQFLAGITGGLAPAFGGTQSGHSTTTTMPSQPSPFNQIAGLGLSVAGLAGGFPGLGMGLGGMGNIGGTGGLLGGLFEEGGAVEPSDEVEGYEFGGFPSFGNPIDDRFALPVLGSDQYQNYGAHTKLLQDYGQTLTPPEPISPYAAPAAFNPDEPLQPRRVTTTSIPAPAAPAVVPAVPLPPPRPASPYGARPPSPTTEPSPPPPIPLARTPEGEYIPRSSLPYPDATDRDWGQKLTRSPWMSLVQAGAKMMQSTKGGLGGLGEGLEAGVGTLADQRKELRGESAINLKAEELMRKARHDLEAERQGRERLAQGRYTWSGGTEIDPATGLPVTGVYRLPTKGDEPHKFIPNVTLIGKPTALQGNAKYLVSIGAANSEADAVHQLRSSMGDPNRRSTLIRAWTDVIVKNDPSYAGDVDAARRKAEQIVSETYGQPQQPQAKTPGSSPDTAMPDPGPGKREKGKWYIGPSGKPQPWNG